MEKERMDYAKKMYYKYKDAGKQMRRVLKKHEQTPKVKVYKRKNKDINYLHLL